MTPEPVAEAPSSSASPSPGGASAQTATAGRRVEGLIRVVSPRRWLWLGMALASLAAGVLYCFFGEAPTQVPASGLMLGPTGIDQVDTPLSGTVVSLALAAGQPVGAGQAVGVVEGPDGRQTTVRSRIGGQVLLTLVYPGDVVASGAPFVEVLPTDAHGQAQIFVSALQGYAVHPGMQVRINPVTAPAAQYGSMLGTVRAVSQVPLSSAAISSLVGSNNELAAVVGEYAPALQVQVDLATDPSTPTGYRWTSGRGPDNPVTPATVLTADVLVIQRRPIDLLLDSGRSNGAR